MRVLALALAGLLLTGCSAQDFAGGTETADHVAPGEQERSAVEGSDAEVADGEGADGEGGSSIDADTQVEERHLVHTADMTVRVEDVDEATERAKELTTASDGYVSAEQVRTPTGGSSVATLTLRVPNDGYEDALAELAELGERSSLERSVEDVTEEVADTESRIASSEAALETLRGYLDEADGVDELLEVESHIQDRQEELEAFQARLAVLENRTAHSTISLSLRSVHEPREDIDADTPAGFLGGLESGARALLTVGQGLLTLVGWLLPFAVVVAVLGAGPWLWWRSRRSEREARPLRKSARGRLGFLRGRGSRRPSTPVVPEHGEKAGGSERTDGTEVRDDGSASPAPESPEDGADRNEGS